MTPTLTVLGCTLFSAIDPDQASSIQLFVSDFEQIQDWNIDSHNAAHNLDLTWLNQQVTEITQTEPQHRIIIFTHYPRTVRAEAHSPRHLTDPSAVRSAFMTDLSAEPCWTLPSVVLWAFGHAHFNCDFVDSVTGKRVVANQKGYRRSEVDDFDSENIVTVLCRHGNGDRYESAEGTPSQRSKWHSRAPPKQGPRDSKCLVS